MTHRSRWGYHPCDYETFLKLRRVHKAYHEGLRLLARWRRWRAKMPHNRRGPEPAVPGVIRKVCAAPVVEAYQAARRPAEAPEMVRPLDIRVEEIDGWLAEM
jgi:hypothetical protein